MSFSLFASPELLCRAGCPGVSAVSPAVHVRVYEYTKLVGRGSFGDLTASDYHQGYDDATRRLQEVVVRRERDEKK